ncbi:unknown protein [Nostoc sp. NIES-3756]|uniref:hypothetical protein n=1 Tax=Nostoc sp. NIES-3756 TaxID=1751286 RepID=UPI000722F729|nr:hypothetical protein [Nostoc sp. NIES-3756]BAT52734.1 unknown protein [Nostoc sp. NIES-3756]
MPDLRAQILLFVSLLFVGIVFWTGGDFFTKQLLGFSYRTLDGLNVDTLPQVILKLDFTLIEMEIDAEEKFTQVEIKTANSMLQRLELEIPNSRFSEVAIAQELGLYPQVKKLQVNQQIRLQVPLDLLAIKATIDKNKKNSFVEVITTNNSLKKLYLLLPEYEVNTVENMTAKLLGLSTNHIRKLISYQLIN